MSESPKKWRFGSVENSEAEDGRAWRDAAAAAHELDMQNGLLEWELEEHGTDHLTGVQTRKAFEEELDHALGAIRESKEDRRSAGEALAEISLIFIDLDGFKRVNDTLGHERGDDVLKKAASVFTNSVRESDVVGRYGGDEFIILLPRANMESALSVANKICENLRSNPELRELGVTASVGVCSSQESSNPSELMHFADMAAKEAKQSGKDRVIGYTKQGES